MVLKVKSDFLLGKRKEGIVIGRGQMGRWGAGHIQFHAPLVVT